MRRIGVFLVVLTLCTPAVYLFKYKKKEQIEFLRNRRREMPCWDLADVSSRQVLIRGKKTSLNDFFQVSNASLEKAWPIKDDNVNELTRLMIAVLSCEYSEFSYYFIEYLERAFVDCQKTNFNDYDELVKFSDYKDCVGNVDERVELFTSHISEMILKLVSFVKNRLASEYDEHDLLKILLSWYLQLKNNGLLGFQRFVDSSRDMQLKYKRNVIEEYVNNHKVLGFQIKIALQGFEIKNCRRHREMIKFVNSFATHDCNTLWAIINSKLKLYQPEIIGNKMYTLHDETRYNKWLEIIRLNLNVNVRWNSEDLPLEKLFNEYVKNSTSIRDILKYEQLMLSLTTELIFGKVLSDFGGYLGTKFDSRTFAYFDVNLKILNALATYLEQSKHSIPLANDIGLLVYRIRLVVRDLKSGRPSTKRVEQFSQTVSECNIKLAFGKGWNISEKLKEFPLVNFLRGFIFELIDNTYLNRKVIGVLNDSSYSINTRRIDYVFDSTDAYVVVAGENRTDTTRKLCDCIRNMGNAADQAYDEWSGQVYDTSLFDPSGLLTYRKSPPSSFDKFNKFVEKLKQSVRLAIATATHDTDERFSDDDVRRSFQNLLLTVLYNVENVRLFQTESQSTTDDGGVTDLLNFLYTVRNQIKKYRRLVCEDSPLRTRVKLSGNEYSFAASENRAKNGTRKTTNTTAYVSSSDEQTSSGKPRDHDATGDEILQFPYDVGKYASFVSENAEVFRRSRVTFYWKGEERSVDDIANGLTNGTSNVQDVVEFQLLTIDWVVCSALSVFVDVLDGFIDYGLDRETIRSDCFEGLVEYFVPLFTNVDSAAYKRCPLIFQLFYDAMRFGEEDKNVLADLRNVIVAELQVFGVARTSSMSSAAEDGRDISERANDICAYVAALETARFSSFFESAGHKGVFSNAPKYEYSMKDDEELLIVVNDA